jgi:hypothetical protein
MSRYTPATPVAVSSPELIAELTGIVIRGSSA